MTLPDLPTLKQQIVNRGRDLSFTHLAVTDTDLSTHIPRLQQWLQKKFHGDMDWMAANLDKRCYPERLLESTLRVITVRMDYRPSAIPLLPVERSDEALVSCYAHGRDYHKTLRHRLATLADWINRIVPHQYRAFVDSAPVLERALAEKSGQGWIGKNTMLINKDAGSWFFLGEVFTNLPLPVDVGADNSNHCGSCSACITSCPTAAIIAPYQVDARKCISYLTIEHKGSIPVELRPLMGNRVFGCDDCQVVCPWNKFSSASTEKDFSPRTFTQHQTLRELFLWSEEEFLKQTEGSPVRRVGYERWLRNLAVGLGNASASPENINALQQRKNFPSVLVREHVAWALAQLTRS